MSCFSESVRRHYAWGVPTDDFLALMFDAESTTNWLKCIVGFHAPPAALLHAAQGRSTRARRIVHFGDGSESVGRVEGPYSLLRNAAWQRPNPTNIVAASSSAQQH